MRSISTLLLVCNFLSTMTSQVPKWLLFFKDAGIPASVASNYAIAFCDHRIQDDMLADLNKEILRDIGVTVMGDIIAILRHAKIVHAQTEREKAANAIALVEEHDTVSGTETPTKKSTAASRMVDHWMNNQRMKSGSRSPVSGSESPNRVTPGKKRLAIKANTSKMEPKTKAASLSDRFTIKTLEQASPLARKKATPKMQKISVRLTNTKKTPAKQKQTAAVKNTVTTTVNVPQTKPEKKKSVFDRLGEEQKTQTKPEIHPPSLKPLKTSALSLKTTKTQSTPSSNLLNFPTSVFSRLGNLSPVTTNPQPNVTVQAVLPSKRPSTLMTALEDDDSGDEIDYTTHSVLRPPRTEQTVKVKPVKPVKPVKRTVGVVSKDSNTSKSVFTRLGPVSE